MTNKQKAIEIAMPCGNCRTFNEEPCIFRQCYANERYEAAIKMAEWKDSQFKTELERLMNRFHDEESHRAYFSIETLQELYNNLFQNVIETL